MNLEIIYLHEEEMQQTETWAIIQYKDIPSQLPIVWNKRDISALISFSYGYKTISKMQYLVIFKNMLWINCRLAYAAAQIK